MSFVTKPPYHVETIYTLVYGDVTIGSVRQVGNEWRWQVYSTGLSGRTSSGQSAIDALEAAYEFSRKGQTQP